MQLIFYLKQLQDKGIIREGKLIYNEKNKKEGKKTEIIKLDDDNINKLNKCIENIEELISQDKVPEVEQNKKCKRCSYYEYCYL